MLVIAGRKARRILSEHSDSVNALLAACKVEMCCPTHVLILYLYLPGLVAYQVGLDFDPIQDNVSLKNSVISSVSFACSLL